MADISQNIILIIAVYAVLVSTSIFLSESRSLKKQLIINYYISRGKRLRLVELNFVSLTTAI